MIWLLNVLLRLDAALHRVLMSINDQINSEITSLDEALHHLFITINDRINSEIAYIGQMTLRLDRIVFVCLIMKLNRSIRKLERQSYTELMYLDDIFGRGFQSAYSLKLNMMPGINLPAVSFPLFLGVFSLVPLVYTPIFFVFSVLLWVAIIVYTWGFSRTLQEANRVQVKTLNFTLWFVIVLIGIFLLLMSTNISNLDISPGRSFFIDILLYWIPTYLIFSLIIIFFDNTKSTEGQDRAKYMVVFNFAILCAIPFLASGYLSLSGLLSNWRDIYQNDFFVGMGLFAMLWMLGVFIQLNLKLKIDILFKLAAGVAILISTGLVFGVLYYQRDRNIESHEIPGFAKYQHATTENYRYHHQLNDTVIGYIKHQLPYAHIDEAKLEKDFAQRNEKDHKGLEGSDKFIDDINESLMAQLGDRPPFKLNEETSKRVLDLTKSEAALPTVYSEAASVTIAAELGSTEYKKIIDKDKKNTNDLEVKLGELCADEKNEQGYECLRGFLAAQKGKKIRILLTGYADEHKFKQFGQAYNDNYELASARAERLKWDILENVGGLKQDDIITLSRSNDPIKKRGVTLAVQTSPNFTPEKMDRSDRLTVADAMFYSAYSITNGGYGMTPLDPKIKFYTLLENFFELVIVAAVIATAITENGTPQEKVRILFFRPGAGGIRGTYRGT